MMKANELRKLHESYYIERRHRVVAPSTLIPENDLSVLFTSAGMQPLIPYFLGQKHVLGSRLVNVQRCVRMGDIEEVGDDYHLTVFEMLGNWSLGDYFKKEAISMSFEFLTQVLEIPVKKLAVTVFQGNDIVPRDIDTYETWLHLGLQPHQIFYYGDEENWWGPAGTNGPCGPDSEMFYVNDSVDCNAECGPACSCGKYVELGNNVFITYDKDVEGNLIELRQKNIDVGLGFERLLVLANNAQNVYETDLFMPLIMKLEMLSGIAYEEENKKCFRIICEHVRAVVFIIANSSSITPSNSEQGYILRRLIRRTIRFLNQLGMGINIVPELSTEVIQIYKEVYPEVEQSQERILREIKLEYERFSKTLLGGLKYVNKYFDNLSVGETLTGAQAFRLYDTYGFPIELTMEIAQDKGILIDLEGYKGLLEEHKERSRSGASGKFKGGLADHDQNSIHLHTATHLLQAALRKVLGDQVLQKGSHINLDRLRFDFSFDRKLTVNEICQVEEIVNNAIADAVDVEVYDLSIEEARGRGAIGVFDLKYDDRVQVYEIKGYSMEMCGGPHADNTSQLGNFRIIKEQSASSGVRRIKAVVSRSSE